MANAFLEQTKIPLTAWGIEATTTTGECLYGGRTGKPTLLSGQVTGYSCRCGRWFSVGQMIDGRPRTLPRHQAVQNG